ncbi:MAG: GNAT family N-acetyltransferase [Sphingobacteriales bacterium]|nr:GNAT family N-acetyltransferase [Sphingobacteriales bacterium]
MILTTERLALRKFQPEDAEFFLKLVNTKGWLQFIGDRNIKTVKDAEDYLLYKIISNYSQSNFGFYIIRLKNTLNPIGMSGLVKRPFLTYTDLGYALLPEYEGFGYAFEASKAMLQYAKEEFKLHTLNAIVKEDNQKSVQLLEKLTFVRQDKIIIPEGEEVLLYEVSL